MNEYTELYAWIRFSFGSRPFGIDSFRSVFPTSQAPKIIHDLVKEGYLQRMGRGTCRAVKPDELIESIISRSAAYKGALETAEKKYAFCDSTAVAVWTEGYYWTSFTRGFRPLHIKILSRNLRYWKKFFVKRSVRSAVAGESKTLFGFVYMLHPEQDFKAVEKEGAKVIPLKETVRFCLKNEMIYQPALEYLDEAYQIGYKGRAFIQT